MKGRDAECLATLARLHAHGNKSDTFVLAEHEEIIQNIRVEREETRNAWAQLFGVRSNVRRLFLGIAIQFSVQMTGVSVIQYYSPRIFAKLGIDTQTALGLQSGNSVIALIGEAMWYGSSVLLGRCDLTHCLVWIASGSLTDLDDDGRSSSPTL